MYEIDLSGKVALVTGGATNIGAACAVRLAQAGARVAINCFPDPANPQEKSEDAENVAKAIRSAGGLAEIFPCDVGDEAACEKMVADMIALWGRVDILVNNAVLFKKDKMLDLTREAFQRMFEVNVLGPFALCRACIPDMLKRSDGAIFFMSSSNVVNGGGDSPAYPACKGALEGMMKNIVKEFGKRGIRCNSLRPSVILTPNMLERHGKEGFEKYVSFIPTPRAGTCDDVAHMVVFLSDSEKAGYLNGGVFHIDGARIYQIHPTSN